MRTLFNPHHTRAVILLMLIAMLATITSSIAAQNGDGVEAPPPEVAEDPVVPAETPAQPTVQPPVEPMPPTEIPTPPAVPTEPQLSQPAPADQPGNEADEPPSAVEADPSTPRRLTISAFHCVADWNQNHITRQGLRQRCTEPGTAAFTVVSDFGTEHASGTSFAFNVIGAITVTETMQQQGFDDPIIYCDVYGPDGSFAHELGPFESFPGEVHLSNYYTGDIHCDWYQLDRSQAKLYIVNMACPHSASLALPLPSMSELIAICTDAAGPITFLVGNDDYDESGVSGGEFNDVYFGDVPYNRELRIWADPPATFESARVFCQITWDGVEDPFREWLVTDFSIGWKFQHGQQMHCIWFNIARSPGLSQADNEPTVAPTTPPQSPGLSQSDDDPAIVPTATYLPGGPGLSQGNATATPADPNQPTPTSGPGLSNGTTPVPTPTATLVPTATAIPTATATAAPQTSNLMVSTYTCPAGYIPQSALAPFTDCTAGPNGVTFTLSDADSSTTDAQATTGAPIPNAVQFAGLQSGDYTLTAPLVSGSGSTFVLGCGASGSGPVETAVPGSLPLQVPAGMLLTCHWFNVPPPV